MLIGAILNSVVAFVSLVECQEVFHPEFVPFDSSQLAETSYFEQFIGDSLEQLGWKVSHAKKDDKFSYLGEWSLEEAQSYPGYKNDKGLVLKKESAHHAISYKLNQPFNNTDQDLVLQYEVKLQDGLTCGGAYIKLLNDGFNELGEFSDVSPYQVMFGPDVCGSNNKIHLIINRKNPLTDKYEEKHLSTSPMSPTNRISTLYTLILKKNQHFEIRIDGEVVKAGYLLKPKLFQPEFNPPKLIVDESDFKPLDWVDQQYIIDTTAQKPKGYDMKHLPLRVPDPDAVKPDDWDESEPEYISDPDAVKPENWDDSVTWEAPKIINPKCYISGCGKWKRPTIPNKDYKGPWIPPRRPNPNYKGEWKPRTIVNPEYYADETPTNLELIGGLGFELWSVDKNILFDNIYLGHSIEEAELIGNTTFLPKIEIEFADYEVNKPKPAKGPIKPPPVFDELLEGQASESSFGILVDFLKEMVNKHVTQVTTTIQNYVTRHSEALSSYYLEFSSDPIHAIKNDTTKFVLHCFGFVTFFTVVFGILNILIIQILVSKQTPTDDPVSTSEEKPQPEITEEELSELIKNKKSSVLQSSSELRSHAATRRKK